MPSSALPDPLSWSELLRVAAGLLAVVAVFVAAVWLLKRLQPGQRASAGPIRVLSTLHLSPRDRLLLVQVGAQQLLLASSAQGLHCLHVLPEPVTPLAAGPGGSTALPAGFADWLRRVVEQRNGNTP